MTFRSEKVSDGKNTVLWLSGRIQSEHLEELRSQIASNGDTIVLDLDQVTLVDVGVIRFLGSLSARASSSVIARLSCVSGSPESKNEMNESDHDQGRCA